MMGVCVCVRVYVCVCARVRVVVKNQDVTIRRLEERILSLEVSAQR